jgi:hypothetical protein
VAVEKIEHGEGLQVLHYEVGQKYEPHYDYFQDTVNIKNGGQRTATLLMYLYVSSLIPCFRTGMHGVLQCFYVYVLNFLL